MFPRVPASSRAAVGSPAAKPPCQLDEGGIHARARLRPRTATAFGSDGCGKARGSRLLIQRGRGGVKPAETRTGAVGRFLSCRLRL